MYIQHNTVTLQYCKLKVNNEEINFQGNNLLVTHAASLLCASVFHAHSFLDKFYV